MKSVQEYIKILEGIEANSNEGGHIKGPFTAGQLVQIFAKIPPEYIVEMSMNEEYYDRVGTISWGNGSVSIDDHL